eukprot:symbB.v1.2.032854.t1/scaffold4003.1/size46508/4
MASEAVTKRQALEVLQSAQEGLSVKAVLELQRMEQVSPSMKAAVAAAICMVSGHYDTAIQVEPLALSRAAWPELRALVVKPGQVISALRNFSFAVDGGNVPARVVQVSKECYEAGEGSPSEEELNLAKAFQSWVQAAWNYWEVVGARRAQEAAAKAEAKPDERIGTRSTRTPQNWWKFSPMLAGLVGLVVAALCAWLAWYVFVLQKAASSNLPWGPKWLAVAVSGALYRFGSWYLQYSDNLAEHGAAGYWKDGKQYVMCWHPHGAFTIAGLYFVSHHWAKEFPSGRRGGQFVSVAPLLLRIPFLAEYLLLCHARTQDRKIFNDLLAQGATMAVQPGGIYEQVETDENQEQLFFPANLGFIRLAIQHGVPLLPVYAFGENQLFRTADWVRRINRFFYKKFKIGNLIVFGLGGIPVSPLIPNPLVMPVPGRRLHIEFGRPVEVGPKEENPSQEKVLEVFEKYSAALQGIFKESAHKYLPKEVVERGLKITLRSKS